MERSKQLNDAISSKNSERDMDQKPREYKIVYHNFLTFGYWHLAGIYGLYLCFTSAKWATIVFSIFLYTAAEIGVTAGAHRLWAHKTYKAKLPLQILLMILNSIAFQNSVLHWARDHRLHHKYTDTDIDPHNAKRGFFYSHVGWLLVKKLPEVKNYGQQIDISDLNNNPVLKFQKRYAIPFIGLVCFIIPTIIPIYFWGESLNNAWHISMLRYISNLNATFLVNSAAHMWGFKPYDKGILSAQNLSVSVATFGEGFHNYHHVFPWDYRAAEFGNNKLNLTTKFIDFFAWLGWAYDLKTVSKDMITRRARRTGDGTNLWGWEDKDIIEEEKSATLIFQEKK
ncbi:acyl-CoA Delta(11) desaturase-like [Achroia grisella]|uniref:acyl-CoA Delta(11) desaturase-like n=1 Tax=Achroia grisella TaxID=688607 RepID=UPI0027D20C56|nr:acyl-CoA Delta(11) desaturase-like [Achroia grisella]XP_059050017.1 acyl-CoA Delta(11) desaturase-like [Achroia grisella]